MFSRDDFFGEMKNDGDRMKEWADAAEFYVGVRRTAESADSPQVEKAAADLKSVGRGVGRVLRRLDPTGIAAAMSTKPGAIAGLSGAALFGLGTALTARGKKEYGGMSALEHNLMEAKKLRESKPEPKSFSGKIRANVADFNAGLASTARKHPVLSGLVGAIGGAKAGTKALSLLTKQAK